MNEILVKLQQHGVNVEEGVERFLSNEELYLKYVRRFTEDQDMGKMLDYYGEKDVKSTFEAAHTLKSTTGNLAIECLYERLKPLVEVLRAGQFPEKTQIEALKKEYDDIIDILNEG